MKRLITTASLLALCAAPALAQSTQPSTSPPAQRSESPATPPTAPPAATTPMDKAPLDKSTSLDKPRLTGNDWRASKLLGQTVRNSANESLGDINEMLIDSDGKVTAVIVGVGGFLGMGEKNVSLALDQLAFSRDANNNIVVTSKVSKETLQAAPEYKLTSK